MNTTPAKILRMPDVRHRDMIRAVIFDYGGVLTYLPTEMDWERMAGIAGVDLFRMHVAYWLHRYPYEIGQYDSAQYWGLVGRDCGADLSGTEVRALVNQDNEQWGRPNPDMIALSRQLRQSGLRTAVLSNMQPDMLTFVRETHGWLNEFEVCIVSCEVAEAKPEPAIFTLTAERLQLTPEDCLFVDDREANVEGARKAGMAAIHFKSADSLPSVTSLLADLGVKIH
jgi:putative hydrolase of the HAD superfamily